MNRLPFYHSTWSARRWLTVTMGVVTALTAGIIFAAPLAATPLPVVEYTGCGGAEVAAIDAAYEARVVELVNQERANNGGLPPLKRVDALTLPARYHAADMGGDNYFKHDTYDRSTDALRYVCGAFDRMGRWYTDWSAVAENIGAGYVSPETVVASWMSGSGHRQNILDANFTEIGVGYYRGGEYGVYWVVDLGVRRGIFPLIINGEATVTAERDVNIYIHGTWSEMRLRNDDGAWGEWRPFSNSFRWMLADSAGERMVSAEVRNGSASAMMSDTIQLDAVVIISPAEAHRVYLPAVTRK